jgi:hypothetical protein
MDTKIRRTLTILVTIVSVSVLLLAVGLATGLSSYTGSDSYKQAACLGKVLEFAQRGIIRDVGGFYGGISECSQIKWSGSIYQLD